MKPGQPLIPGRSPNHAIQSEKGKGDGDILKDASADAGDKIWSNTIGSQHVLQQSCVLHQLIWASASLSAQSLGELYWATQACKNELHE
mmetsp:Transcript_102190/g.288677  ORF Transcript_102190/g.288677 Transcript_102190/m.288677 type:complete len:89 (+) Transcript_102190:750-1016(+)